ncbi:hypothetical protein [uncultured Helicobacter sp.]|nr:hypothetical protein [uncultured Helicobacter sp.]
MQSYIGNQGGEPRYSLSHFALAVALPPPYSQSYAPREGRE